MTFWILCSFSGNSPRLFNIFIFCFLKTSLSTEAILKFLKKKGFDVVISDDAGRFVCNYVYYHSLRFAEQKGHKSLFVHVPLFSTIDEDTQMQFVATLFEAVASTCWINDYLNFHLFSLVLLVCNETTVSIWLWNNNLLYVHLPRTDFLLERWALTE